MTRALAVGFVWLSISGTGLAGGRYSFSNLQDSTSGFTNFSAPVISRVNGAVAFAGRLEAGQTGIFTVFGGRLTTNAIAGDGAFIRFADAVTNSLDAFDGYLRSADIAINSAGTVVFLATRADGVAGVFSGHGGTVRLWVDDKDRFKSFHFEDNTVRWAGLSINDAGTLAVAAQLKEGGTELLMISPSGEIRTLTSSSKLAPALGLDSPMITSSGVVGFRARLPDLAQTYYSEDPDIGTPARVLATGSGANSFRLLGMPSLNDIGVFSFWATRDNSHTVGVFTTALADIGPSAIYSETQLGLGFFVDYTKVTAINKSGRVIFSFTGNKSIYSGPNEEDRVIGYGDSLFGSTVSAVTISRQSLDESGRIAFSYALADGRSGIAVSSPPPARNPTGDLLIKASEEPSSAFRSQDEFLPSPEEEQLRVIEFAPKTNSVIAFDVLLRNAASEPVSYILSGEETGDTGWKMSARLGVADLWSTLKGDGYVIESLGPGASLQFRVELSGTNPAVRLPSGTQHGFAISVAKKNDPFLVHDAVGARAETVVDLVVNTLGDKEDFDDTDGVADVDRDTPGQQVTLRAAIQTAIKAAGRQRITFDLPNKDPAGPTIRLLNSLPVLTGVCEIAGETQPGAGRVAIDGSALASNSAVGLDVAGKAVISGLSFVGFPNALRLSGGASVVKQCFFGLDAKGQLAASNSASVLITSGKLGPGNGMTVRSNIFVRGAAGVVVHKQEGGVSPKNATIDGNTFGRMAGSDAQRGPHHGVIMANASSCVLGGLVPAARNSFFETGTAVVIAGKEAANNAVLGNWIGLTADGVRFVGESWLHYGVVIAFDAHHNQVGSSAAGSRNIIGGCFPCGVLVTLRAHDNAIEGNWIGLNSQGTGEAYNNTGVWLQAGSKNRLGGSTPAQRNIIAGNLREGVKIGHIRGEPFRPEEDPGTELCSEAQVQGNWIGLDPSGTRAIPNGRDWSDGHGIRIAQFADGTLVGGNTEGKRNLVGGNEGPGITVEGDKGTTQTILGNYIGLAPDGTSPRPNHGAGIKVYYEPVAIIGGFDPGALNRIAFNTGAGIDLSYVRSASATPLSANLIYNNLEKKNIALQSSPLANDPGDADVGANGLQNWPFLLGAFNQDGATVVVLDVSSLVRNTPIRLDLFRAAGGGGDLWLGGVDVTTGSNSRDVYGITMALQAVGTEITALATSAEGTSEFSPITRVYAGQDTDQDGIPDSIEESAPVPAAVSAASPSLLPSGLLSTPTQGDRNADDVPDASQANVSSVQIPNREVWITIEAGSDLELGYAVGLARDRVPRLPIGTRVEPGAVRFDLYNNEDLAQPIRFLLPPQPTLPTVWLLANSGWKQIAVDSSEKLGGLLAIRFLLPPNLESNTWVVALGQPASPKVDAPLLTLFPWTFEPLGRDETVPPPAFNDESTPTAVLEHGWVHHVRVALPPDSPDAQLETSADLIQWNRIDATPFPNSPYLDLAWPEPDPYRFFRWNPDVP
ncbi:MAG: hypothetical protein HY299_14840 [Verrucomicrobia bacterium]|nr:hypothetical protein [Verrucomicrobiota bacterium]